MRISYTLILLYLFTFTSYTQNFTWQKNKGPDGGKTGDLFSIGDTICTISNAQLYFSTNKGENWEVKSITYNFPRIFKASDGSYLGRISDEGIFRSYDLGSWELIYPVSIGTLEMDPNGNFYMINNKDVLFSKDNCNTWVLSFRFNNDEYPKKIAFSNNYVYVLESKSIIRKTFDTADSWRRLTFPEAIYNTNCIAADTNGNVYVSTIMSRMAYSTNNGSTWIYKDISELATSCNGITCSDNSVILNVIKSVNNVYYSYLLFSYNNKISWEILNKGLANITNSIFVKQINGDYYANLSGTGPYKLLNKIWQPRYMGMTESNFLSLTNDKEDNFWAAIQGRGIYKSGDKGNTWLPVRIDSANNFNPYTLKRTTDGDLLAGYYNKIYCSTNNGKEWNLLSVPLNNIAGYVLYTDRFNRIFLSVGLKSYMSIDKGNTWLLYYTSNSNPVKIHAPSPFHSVVTTGYVFTTTNNGTSWTRLNFHSYSKACSDNSGIVVVPTSLAGFSRSTDYGLTWRHFNDNRRFGGELAYDSKGNFFNYETWLNIFYFSSDKGETWVNAAGNLPGTTINEIFVHNDKFYLATKASLWKLASPSTDVTERNELLPARHSLSQNYPNPFNPSTEISFNLSKDDFVKIIVYSTLGREIAVLANEFRKAGTHQVSFKGENLPSGIYFCRLVTKEYSETIKMMLIR